MYYGGKESCTGFPFMICLLAVENDQEGKPGMVHM